MSTVEVVEPQVPGLLGPEAAAPASAGPASIMPAWVHAKFARSIESPQQRVAQNGGVDLRPLRQAAREHFSALGFPTPRNEDWKYTNTAPIARSTFGEATPPQQALDAQTLQSLQITSWAGPRMVFINGRYAPEISTIPAGGSQKPTISSLSAASPDDAGLSEILSSHFGRHADSQRQAFVALNTALAEDAAIVSVPEGVCCSEPIVVLFIVTADQADVAVYPRVLIHLAARSQATVVECYAGLSAQSYLTTAVTEVVVGEGAVGRHYRIQLEGPNAYHVSTTEIVQAQKSNFTTHTYSFGGMLVRNDVNPTLNGEGIETTLNGLTLLDNKQHVDNHTVIDHAKPHSVSNELYKGIYAGSSHGVFNGTIIVRQDAQKTNAIQSNQTLLLSNDAEIAAKPQLKIWADDVRCTHGATIGQISDDALFYLQSRGIDARTAKHMLIHGFASDLLDQISLVPLRQFLEALIADKLQAIEAGLA